MADDGNKKKDTRRKRRKVESDTDAGLIDLTTQTYKIHDVVDLTAPVVPKPVSKNQSGDFRPKTFGDCEILSSRNDNMFDDDIVIVVSDDFRQKKKEERQRRLLAVSGPAPSSAATSTATPPSTGTAAVVATTAITALSSGIINSVDTLGRYFPSASSSTNASSNTTASSASQSAATTANNHGRLSLTVDAVRHAATAVLGAIGNFGSTASVSNASAPTPAVPTPSAVNSQPGPSNGTPTEFQLWVKFRNGERRKSYLCPCTVCGGRQFFVTLDTVTRHCRLKGVHSTWVPADQPSAATTLIGQLAITAGAVVNTPSLVAPSQPTRPPQVAHPPRPLLPSQSHPPAALQPPSTNMPVIADHRRNRPGPPSLDNLPTVPQDTPQDTDTSFTCPICLDSKNQIQASNRCLVSTICGHVFCSFCILQIFRSSKQCPQCRKKLPPKNGWHNLYI